MAQQGATLQQYNNELVKCLEELRRKRSEVHEQILAEEEEKAKLQAELRLLSEQMSRVTESLAKKMTTRSEYDQTIAETEQMYDKILESSQTLLHLLKSNKTSLDASGTRSVR
eukprot:m.491557 g.491557  ORF g.491557 m.491557 type:complete len:113 (-) comp30277_c0_seq1:507-845(-)